MPSASKLTPEAARPYPRVVIQKKKGAGNRKGQSRIYTDTPEKDRLEEIEAVKENRKKKRQEMILKKATRNIFANKKPNKAKKFKQRAISDSSDSEISVKLVSDDDISEEFSDEGMGNQFLLTDEVIITTDDFLLVKFPTKSNVKFYVGKVVNVLNQQEFEVSFLRCTGASRKFSYPIVSDISLVSRIDVTAKLPVPISSTTARTSSLLCFNFNFATFNVQ